ncbi:MAG: hypothetical protein ACREP9_21910, partial [Candidatus Dormibacteraceae bacterium]
QAERITLALTVLSGATASLAQAGFAPLTIAFARGFGPAIRLFDILALTILLLPAATVPSLVLDSNHVNRQGRHLLIWTAALLVNVAANVLVLRIGWGAQAVAINDVWLQLVVVIVLFEMASRYIWGNNTRRRRRLYAALGGALTVSAAATVILDASASSLRPGHLDVLALLARCSGAAAAWALVAILLLRPHVPWRTREASVPTDSRVE